MNSTDLIRLGKIYSVATGRALTTIGKNLANHGAFFPRLEEGHTITEARLARVTQAFSDHWPSELAWPVDISRPARTSDRGRVEEVA